MNIGIKHKAAKGFLWNSLGTLLGGFFSFIVTMILARLLTPSDFGLVALLTIFSSISTVIIESGFSKAIIRDTNPSQTDLSTVFFLNVFIATLIYIILFICAPLISSYFNAPSLLKLSRVVFTILIINSVSLIPTANLSRQLDFKTQAKANIFGAFISGCIALVMAYYGFGVWALVANMVGLAFFRMIFLTISNKWIPTVEFSFLSIKKYFLFGSNLLALNFVDKVVTNFETFIIGRLYTKSELGEFSQSHNLNSYFTSNIFAIIQTVTYPSLAKLHNDRLKRGYRNVFSISMFVLLPFTLFFSIVSDNAMVTLFGIKWLAAGSYLRLWTIAGLFVAIYSIFFNIFLVTGHSLKLFICTIIRQVLRVFFVIILAPLSITSVLWGILVVNIIGCMIYVIIGAGLINYSLREIITDITPLLYKSLIASLMVYLVGLIISGLARELQFTIQMAVMGGFYFGLMHFTKDKSYLEIKSLLKMVLTKQ